MEKIKNRFQNWIEESSKGKRAEFWLSFLSFTDAFFSPIPPDIYMIPVLMAERAREKWLKYSTIVSLSSVLGGIFGYIIGFSFFSLFGEKIVEFYSLQDEISEISSFLSRHTFWAVFIGAFTPLPYQVFSISSGLFKVSFLTFVFASLVGRGMRYFLMGWIMKIFGEKITKMVFKYFNTTVFIFLMLLVVILFF